MTPNAVKVPDQSPAPGTRQTARRCRLTVTIAPDDRQTLVYEPGA
jgi:hypothetical protein